jgi:hypothetical protein
MLVHKLMGAKGVASPALYDSYQDSGSELTTYTFASDTYESGVLLIAAHGKRLGSSAYSISSVSLGGSSATEVIQVSAPGSNRTVVGFYQIPLATSTTGQIAVTFSVAQLRAAIGVFLLPSAYELQSQTSTTVDSGNTASLTLGDASTGWYFAASTNNGGETTWGNITEVYDNAVAGNAFTAASGAFVSGSGSLNVTAASSTTFSAVIAAKFVK